MAFGRTVTTLLTEFFPNDPVAPQVVGDFARLFPTDPLKGAAVSDFASNLLPPSPIHPADLGSNLSEQIALLIGSDSGPGLGDGFILF